MATGPWSLEGDSGLGPRVGVSVSQKWDPKGCEQEGMTSKAGAAQQGRLSVPTWHVLLCLLLAVPLCGRPLACLRVSADHALLKAHS